MTTQICTVKVNCETDPKLIPGFSSNKR